MKILETQNLTKKYKKITALQDLNLVVESEMVFGLLGPNGSGKTTTLGLLLDVLKATSGSYTWFGEKPRASARKRIGAILESPCFYPYMTGAQNLRVVTQIKECELSSIDRVLKVVGLSDRKDDPFKTYSLGMKQRLAIGSALLADPEVLILDEPTNGLDPQGIVEIRDLIRHIARTGKTVILASHLLDEVQKVCTHFAVLRKGEKLYQGSVSEALFDQSTIDVAADDMLQLRSVLEEFNGVNKITQKENLFQLTVQKEVNTRDLNQYLIDHQIIASHLAAQPGSLEARFLKILDSP